MPSRTTNNLTPITRLLKLKPDYSFLRTFGCACWPNLRKYNSRKLKFRSKMCTFLGYSSIHKGYKCLDRTTGRVYISRDVVFDESRFPFAISDITTTPSSSCPVVTFPQNEPDILNEHMNAYDLSLLLSNSCDAETTLVTTVLPVSYQSHGTTSQTPLQATNDTQHHIDPIITTEDS